MDVDWWVWIVFGAFVVLMLYADLRLFGRGSGQIAFREAAIWSVGWTVLGVAFAAVLLVWQGRTPAEEYLTGFLIEKSLSIDNLFVFALIFSYFAVPPLLQRRVIFWGITGAVVLRAIFIFAGAALLDAVHWMIYVFGGFLILTGIRMARHSGVEIHPEHNPVLRLLRRAVPVTNEYHGDSFFVRLGGQRMATPMLAALVLVATFDLVFAVDSIPAIFAITRDTFLVLAANAFSLLGLSALFFLLLGLMGRFRYLNLGLAVVLCFVGAKMVVSEWYKIPAYLSLAVVLGVIGLSVLVSWLRPEAPEDGRAPTEPPAPVEPREAPPRMS